MRVLPRPQTDMLVFGKLFLGGLPVFKPHTFWNFQKITGFYLVPIIL